MHEREGLVMKQKLSLRYLPRSAQTEVREFDFDQRVDSIEGSRRMINLTTQLLCQSRFDRARVERNSLSASDLQYLEAANACPKNEGSYSNSPGIISE